jgi:hypothetical protein
MPSNAARGEEIEMPEQDKPGITGPEYPPPSPPPPRALLFAGIALAFEAATVLALLSGRDDLATLLAIVGVIAGGVTAFLLWRAQDVAPIVGPMPGPPPRRE